MFAEVNDSCGAWEVIHDVLDVLDWQSSLSKPLGLPVRPGKKKNKHLFPDLHRHWANFLSMLVAGPNGFWPLLPARGSIADVSGVAFLSAVRLQLAEAEDTIQTQKERLLFPLAESRYLHSDRDLGR